MQGAARGGDGRMAQGLLHQTDRLFHDTRFLAGSGSRSAKRLMRLASDGVPLPATRIGKRMGSKVGSKLWVAPQGSRFWAALTLV